MKCGQLLHLNFILYTALDLGHSCADVLARHEDNYDELLPRHFLLPLLRHCARSQTTPAGAEQRIATVVRAG